MVTLVVGFLNLFFIFVPLALASCLVSPTLSVMIML